MKSFILILIMLFSLPAIAQDNVILSKEEAKNIAEKIKGLQTELQLTTQELDEYKKLDKTNQFIIKRDSMLIALKDKQIELLNEQIKLYEKKSNRSFFDSKTWGFIQGVALMTGASYIISNVK